MKDRGFIPVDEALRTNVEGVWAIGEVNCRGVFTQSKPDGKGDVTAHYQLVQENIEAFFAQV